MFIEACFVEHKNSQKFYFFTKSIFLCKLLSTAAILMFTPTFTFSGFVQEPHKGSINCELNVGIFKILGRWLT